MHVFKDLTRNVVTTLAMLIALSAGYLPAVHATLLDVAGEKFSFDSSSGLEWLDLPETAGLSYNAVVGGIGNTWLADGWRYANADEVKYLLQSNLPSAITASSSEGSPQPGDFYASSQPDIGGGASRFVFLLGDTYALIGSSPPGATGIYGRQISAPGDPEVTHSLAAVLLQDLGVNFFATMQGGAYDANGHGYVGHFLVRPTAIPEPSSLALVGLGAAALLLSRLGRKCATLKSQ